MFSAELLAFWAPLICLSLVISFPKEVLVSDSLCHFYFCLKCLPNELKLIRKNIFKTTQLLCKSLSILGRKELFKENNPSSF